MPKRSRGGEKVTIKIPRPLYERIGQLIDGAGYNSVTEFVVHVLRDIVTTHTLSEEQVYTEADLERVKARLRSLGYL
ncbi:MAG TPA: CopG family transcriptional regulator [Armatimonadota bacterium]|nr:CopG family transcriptional regulator [Armatimonadota bacterium]